MANPAALLFDNTKVAKDLTQYNLFKGVVDYGNLAQFNLYEKGYSYLKVINVPVFMEKLGEIYDSYGMLVNNFKHILEYEFKGLEGIDNLTTDTMEITNGINAVNVINKVNQQSQATVSMTFYERSGSIIAKFTELYLRGIKDPMTQTTNYNGLIEGINGVTLERGFENEIFTLMYIVTDSTRRQIEKAFLLLAGQFTNSMWDMYNGNVSDIGTNVEVNLEMNCFPVNGAKVNEKAKEILDWMNNDDNPDKIVLDSSNFNYTGLDNIRTNA